MSMELMESGIVRENHPCRHEGRIEFKVRRETSGNLVGKGDEPKDRLQDLAGVGFTQRLRREAEQLRREAEQKPVLIKILLSLRVEQIPILKDLELSRKVKRIPIVRDLGTVLKDHTAVTDLRRMRRTV